MNSRPGLRAQRSPFFALLSETLLNGAVFEWYFDVCGGRGLGLRYLHPVDRSTTDGRLLESRASFLKNE
jgi:hypothetical protein